MTLEEVLKKEKGKCLSLVNKNADLNRQVLTVIDRKSRCVSLPGNEQYCYNDSNGI